MRLRPQLLLLSLLTLTLPWAGCQYIQEVDRTLRAGQASALAATAQAIAARLAAEPELLNAGISSAEPARQLYVHPLERPILVDGYGRDWRELELTPRRFSHGTNRDFGAELTLASDDNHLYMLVEVRDPTTGYHHPGHSDLANGDHLVLASGTALGFSHYYVISASAPGPINVKFRDNQGQVGREHRIQGHWQETAEGYRVELQLPKPMAADSLALAAVNKGHQEAPQHLGTLPDTALLVGNARDPGLLPPVTGQLVYPLPALEEALAVFSRPGVRLRLIDRNGWQRASVGKTARATATSRPHWLLRLMYRAALSRRELPDYPRDQGGFNLNPVVHQALEGEPAGLWHQEGKRQLGSAAAAIRLDPEHLEGLESMTPGVVLVEQSSDAMQALTESAFSRLLLIGLGSTLLLTLALLGYASWLSWRIRRLSHSVSNVFDAQGRLSGAGATVPSVRARDEIGDLARNYAQLHGRLQGYTDYLKTLAAKLSHELRTPLAVVRSSLDNLEHYALPPEAQTYTERAQGGVMRLSRLLTAMSEANRMEASISRAEREPVALDQLLRDMAAAYRDIYPDHRIALDIKPRNDGYVLELAPDLMVQLLDKLMDNASDFCPPGGEIRLNLAPEAGNRILLEVSNEGPPLPEAMQSQLFDSLVSLREDRTSGPHLGLGLPIVQLIAQFHGGRVRARNNAKGAVFAVSLPAHATLVPEDGTRPGS